MSSFLSVVLAIWVSQTRRVVFASGNLKSCSVFVTKCSLADPNVVHPNWARTWHDPDVFLPSFSLLR